VQLKQCLTNGRLQESGGSIYEGRPIYGPNKVRSWLPQEGWWKPWYGKIMENWWPVDPLDPNIAPPSRASDRCEW